MKLNGFSASGKSQTLLSLPSNIYLRHNACPTCFPYNPKIYMKLNGLDTLSLNPSTKKGVLQVGAIYTESVENVLSNDTINRGSDNLFVNSSGDGSSTDLERLDFIFSAGYAISDVGKGGFMLLERGGNDPFKIAVVKTIDGTGKPTSYGNLISVPATAWGTTNLLPAPFAHFVMQKSQSFNELRPVGEKEQIITGLYFTLQNLGIANNERFYGYSVFPNDVSGTPAQLVDWTNSSFFPTNTSDIPGGLDLVAGGGFFIENSILPAPPEFRLVNAEKMNTGNKIIWNVQNENELKEYQVMGGTDGRNWNLVKTVAAGRNGTYNVLDAGNSSNNYYQIKATAPNGQTWSSLVVRLTDTKNQQSKLMLGPNPVTGAATIPLLIPESFNNQPSNISISSVSGLLVYSKPVFIQTTVTNFKLPGTLTAGTYLLQVSGANGNHKPVTEKLILQ
jgi:hypothetical protein